ncbi:uncharacterized protein B0P05DRAFT_475710, partial [Gilbertella persicaria]|uniref:uncharacterized protein n=1 Tax=Gilbertella persicaria TaxID=101096 RepID=UPI00221FD53D
ISFRTRDISSPKGLVQIGCNGVCSTMTMLFFIGVNNTFFSGFLEPISIISV